MSDEPRATEPTRGAQAVAPQQASHSAVVAAGRAPVGPGRERVRLGLLCVALLAAVGWTFGGVADHGFVGFDDPGYIHDNPHVTSGLTTESIGWAFTHVHMGNWHPLTWISHMLDWELFGADAGGHHLMNVALHGATAVLLMLAWRALSGRTFTAALVAALFALHPLRAESVAWASERKDVLAGLFFAATLLAWARHARAPSGERLAGVCVLLALGLMAKPMLVTVPALLLLLDAWPLRRRQLILVRTERRTTAPGPTTPDGATPEAEADADATFPRATLRDLMREQLPLLAIVAASIAATVAAQQAGHAIRSLDALPWRERLLNLPVAYGQYLASTLRPSGLAFLHPHPSQVPGVDLPGAALRWGALLLVVTGCCLWAARRGRPWLLLGWLWFVGMLVPVSGLVAVGEAGWADRYSYLPCIGLGVMAAHEAAHLVERHPRARLAVATLCLVILAALGWATQRQVETWRDGETLYRRALAISGFNPTVHTLLGVELLRADRLDEARVELEQAVEQSPGSVKAHYNLGAVALARGELDEAEAHFRRALQLKPELAVAYNDLAVVAVQRGDRPGARKLLRKALALDPDDARAAANLAALQGDER